MKTGADMEAPAESDDRLSTGKRRRTGSSAGERVSYGSARARAMERRRKRILRRRILTGSILAILIAVIGGSIFGIRNLFLKKEKTAFLEEGMVYMEQGDYETAILSFEKELELADGRLGELEEQVLLYRAEAEYLLKDYAAALHSWKILLEEDKKNPVYQKGAALGMMETGDFTGALALDVINAHVYNRMAKAQIESGQYEDALASVQLGRLELEEDAKIREAGQESRYTEEEVRLLQKYLAFHEAVVWEYQGDYAKALELLEAYAEAYGSEEEIQREITFLKTRQGTEPLQ